MGTEVNLPDAAGGFIQGADARVDLVNRAVNLEKQRYDLDEQKKEVAAKKTTMLAEKGNNIIAMAPGPLRKLAIKQFGQLNRDLGVPYDPAMDEVLNDDGNYVNLGKAFSAMYGLTDRDQKAQALNGYASIAGDAVAAMPKIADAVAKIDQEREKARLEAQAKGKKSIDPLEVVRTTNQTIQDMKTANNSQIQTITAVNSMNALGADPDTRKNPIAQDTAQVLLAKMNDPSTGVREQEMARITGLGIDYFTKAKLDMQKAANGAGVLPEKSWQRILTVANILGQKSQQVLDASKKQRSPGFVAAGMNPDDVYSQLPQYQPYDFKSNFGEVPRGLKSPDDVQNEKMADEALKQKQSQNQAIIDQLQKKGWTIDQINAKVAEMKKKGSNNGNQKQAAK